MNELQRLVIALGAIVGLTLVISKTARAGSAAWTPPHEALPYLDAIRLAEIKYGLPESMLAALIQQESAYRHDIIYGEPNEAGAVGIAQIVPRWHPDANASDPFAAIDYAAGYLRRNFDRFHSWDLALAAYNWGPTNLAELGLSKAPAETQNYIAQINQRVYA